MNDVWWIQLHVCFFLHPSVVGFEGNGSNRFVFGADMHVVFVRPFVGL
jgi:hypothetical protein